LTTALPKPGERGLRMPGLLLFLGLYSICLAVLLPRQSLWLDEILNLIGALKPDLRSLIVYLRTLPGNTPLGHLLMAGVIRLGGFSMFTARVSSAALSVAACPGIFLLGKRLGLRRPLYAVLVFVLCPLQFRYALEARPYALALCLSIWSTVIFLALTEKPRSRVLAVSYAILAVAGIYTFAYALFVPASHFVWLLVSPARWTQNRRLIVITGCSIAGAVLTVLPWYLYMQQGWSTGTASLRLGSFLDGRPVQVILHELTGAGYAGTVLILAGAWWGLRRLRPPQGIRSFWILYALFPVVLILAADVAFGYFLAIRQMIFILAPLTLLFAAGAEAMGRPGKILLGAFLAASVYGNVNWFLKPREDWQAAAKVATDNISRTTCLVFVPADAEQLYLFFRPELAARKCLPNGFGGFDSVILAISPYDSNHAYPSAHRDLEAAGLTMKSEYAFYGPRVELYRK
jgi:Dolichyl-phosphate-mannose-protein mannosyltransferase